MSTPADDAGEVFDLQDTHSDGPERKREPIESLIERSSLGTPEAKAARESTDPQVARLVVRLSQVMGERNAARAEVDSLRAEVERLRELRGVEGRLLEPALNDAQNEIERLRPEVQYWIAQVEATEADHDEARDERDSLRVTLAAASSTLAYIRYLIENASDEELSALTEQIDWHASRALIPTDPVSLADVRAEAVETPAPEPAKRFFCTCGHPGMGCTCRGGY